MDQGLAATAMAVTAAAALAVGCCGGGGTTRSRLGAHGRAVESKARERRG